MLLSKTKVDNLDGATPVCVRCLYIRYFLLCVLAIALLGLMAGDELRIITELTPLHFAYGVVAVLALIAIIRAVVEFRLLRQSDESRERTGRTANS